MKLRKSSSSSKSTVKILVVILFFALPVVGFYFGLRYQSTIPQMSQNNNKTEELENEITLILEDRASVESEYTEPFSQEKTGIYSPLLEGKQASVTEYRYRRETIVERQVDLENGAIELWEYHGAYNSYENKIPDNFAEFGGYENNALVAQKVSALLGRLKDKYSTKNKLAMFYDYHYTPKSIGAVSLNSYISFVPNIRESFPLLLKVWYNKVEGFPDEKTDPAVIKAKQEVNKIADTIQIGLPE